MNQPSIKKAAIFMLVATVCVMTCWEIYLRSTGLKPTYNDDSPLWADKRAMVYEPRDKTVVIVGSSRAKYDIDIPTWEKMTGTHAVQLAMTGSNPRPVLTDLANDQKFNGRIIIDITEFLFYSDVPRYARKPSANLAYYKSRTPAQRVSFELNRVLESQFVFLDKEFLSINGKLNRLRIPPRAGVFPPLAYPIEFERTDFNEQAKLAPKFLTDTSIQNQVKAKWKMVMSGPPQPPMSEEAFAAIFKGIKFDIDKIKARGGDVVFLRTPASGFVEEAESHAFPKAKFWDRLLSETGCKGYYYKDYSALDHFICPEDSHLSPQDAVIYTENIVRLMMADKALQLAVK